MNNKNDELIDSILYYINWIYDLKKFGILEKEKQDKIKKALYGILFNGEKND